MQMLEYISAVQRKLIDEYGLAERSDAPGIPESVPDGEYPMTIDGRMDWVFVKDGQLHCCSWARKARGL